MTGLGTGQGLTQVIRDGALDREEHVRAGEGHRGAVERRAAAQQAERAQVPDLAVDHHLQPCAPQAMVPGLSPERPEGLADRVLNV